MSQVSVRDTLPSQFRVEFDATHYYDVTVEATGRTILSTVGGGALGFTGGIEWGGGSAIPSSNLVARLDVPAAFTSNVSVAGTLTQGGVAVSLAGHTHALSAMTGGITYGQLPNISGSWDVGVGNTLTLSRATNLASIVGVGGAPNSSVGLWVQNTSLSGSTTVHGVLSMPVGPTSATARVVGVTGQPATAASAYTVAEVIDLWAGPPTKGAGSTITIAYGLKVEDITAGATNYSIYTGTAPSRFGGNIGVGADPEGRYGIKVMPTTLTTNNQNAIYSSPEINSAAATGWGACLVTQVRTAATAFNLTNSAGIYISNLFKGAGSTVTNVYGIFIENMSGGTGNNFGIYNMGAMLQGNNLKVAYPNGTVRIEDTASYYPTLEFWALGAGPTSSAVARMFGYAPGSLWFEANALLWRTNAGVEHMRISNSRNLLIGGTDIEGGTYSGGGDVIIRGGGRAYRSVNTAGLSTLPLISLSANDRTLLHGTLEVTGYGSVAGVTGGPSYAVPSNPATWIPVYVGTTKYAMPLYNAT